MSIAQLALVRVAPQPLGLTPDQEIAWALITSVPGGVWADEIGAAVHAAKGKHTDEERCTFCADRGKSLARSKALSQLVVRRRKTNRYEPRDPAYRPHQPTGDIPW